MCHHYKILMVAQRAHDLMVEMKDSKQVCCVLRSNQKSVYYCIHIVFYTTNQGGFGQVQEVWVWPICTALPSHLLSPQLRVTSRFRPRSPNNPYILHVGPYIQSQSFLDPLLVDLGFTSGYYLGIQRTQGLLFEIPICLGLRFRIRPIVLMNNQSGHPIPHDKTHIFPSSYKARTSKIINKIYNTHV